MDHLNRDLGPSRRKFIQIVTVAGCALFFVPGSFAALIDGKKLEVSEKIGRLHTEAGKTPIPRASWFIAESSGDGLSYRFPAGTLRNAKYLTTDLLVDENDLMVFAVELQEGELGGIFRLRFGVLPQCSGRLRFALKFVDQRRSVLDREGAILKPQCGGDLVNLAKVDRIRFTVSSKHRKPARWCMTPLLAVAQEVDGINQPMLPKGKLLDELGQSTTRTWSSKTRNVDEVKKRISGQWKNAAMQMWPEEFSRWGGWKSKKLTDGKGFFQTHNDGKRWWMVDPDGHAFWSTGLDCVTVDQTVSQYDGLESTLNWLPNPSGEFRDIYTQATKSESKGKLNANYLIANLIRALGPDGWRDKWAATALAQMKQLRFNTVGNWSEWNYAKASGFPYVRPMKFNATRSGRVFREFPDVFNPVFQADAAEFASTLSDTVGDPAFIGYFLMNEPDWGNVTPLLPAAGMLYQSTTCFTRSELTRFLKKKYSDDTALSARWKMPVTFRRIESGKWQGTLPDDAQDDLRDFSSLMVERYFGLLSAACRKVDPNHLNLGVRYDSFPPAWALSGMKTFDVFSMNRYATSVPHSAFEEIHRTLKMPIIIGEFGFGALDVGLPGTGPAPRLKNQSDRGKEYRLFVEDAAADPYCVGAHWFQMYDQSALGRPDGECYNLGFVDVCNQIYSELGQAAIATHERLYQVADGHLEAYRNIPEYLPQVSM